MSEAVGGGDIPSASSTSTIFVRKATGLLKGWSMMDAFLYASMSVSVVALGFYIFSFAPFIPRGNLVWALVIAAVVLLSQVVTYAALIAIMPRAGGDYIWISRVLGGEIGFVLACAGWWFIMWHWIPIYGNLLIIEVLDPLGRVMGWTGFADFWATQNGVFTACLIDAVMTAVLVTLGMRGYARVQKVCFVGGIAGLVIMFGLFLTNSRTDFANAFDSSSSNWYGVSDAYSKVLDAGTSAAGYAPAGLSSFDLGATLLLIPMMLFYNMWSNWGGALYGEVRGATDFRKNIYAMGGALVISTIVAVAALLTFAHSIGWDFYNGANNAYWSGTSPVPDFPYPGLFAAMLTDVTAIQALLILLLGCWFVGSAGTVFLSASRAVFAFAFDRMLPEWAAKVTGNGIPVGALALMVLPSIAVSYFYAYSSNFATWTLDATLVIAIAFLGSGIAAAILPWRRPDLYNASPIARYRVGPIPLITVSGSIFSAVLAFALYEWWRDPVYGVNNSTSLRYMVALYALAVVLLLLARFVRRQQGIDMRQINREIPVE
jgi:basic amino acid/polyamine antiporter, APA family